MKSGMMMLAPGTRTGTDIALKISKK